MWCVGLRFSCARAAPAWRSALPSRAPLPSLPATRILASFSSRATPRGRASSLDVVALRRAFSSSRPSLSATPPPPTPTTGDGKPKPALSEDILTLPNVLTMVRLALTPYIGYLVATHQFVPGCALLFVASITDVLDGWLARRTGKYTVFGSIADPAADKALVTTMVIALALSGMLPWPMAAIIIGRDVALVASAFVIRYRTLEPPKTLQRYFNPRLPSASVTPTQISKYNTFLQLVLLGVLTLYPILYPNSPPPGMLPEATQDEAGVKDTTKSRVDLAIAALMWIVAATTVWSGLGYVGGGGASKVLANRTPALLKRRPPPPPSA